MSMHDDDIGPGLRCLISYFQNGFYWRAGSAVGTVVAVSRDESGLVTDMEVRDEKNGALLRAERNSRGKFTIHRDLRRKQSRNGIVSLGWRWAQP